MNKAAQHAPPTEREGKGPQICSPRSPPSQVQLLAVLLPSHLQPRVAQKTMTEEARLHCQENSTCYLFWLHCISGQDVGGTPVIKKAACDLRPWGGKGKGKKTRR